VSEPLIEGPGPPASAPSPPEQRVSGLVPFVHVEDVERSIAFYHQLGFLVASVYRYRGTSVWAELRSEGAELMVSTDGDSIDPAGQGVLFYLYSDDLAALRGQLLANGIHVGEIEDGTPRSGERTLAQASFRTCYLPGGVPCSRNVSHGVGSAHESVTRRDTCQYRLMKSVLPGGWASRRL
jgi:hypothetical protein